MNGQRAHEDEHFAHDDAGARHGRFAVVEQSLIGPAEIVVALDGHHGAKVERLADARISLFPHACAFMHARAGAPLAGVHTGVGAELAGPVKAPPERPASYRSPSSARITTALRKPTP